MVNPEKGKKYLKQVNAITNKYRPKNKSFFKKKDSSSSHTETRPAGKKPWWKFW